MNILQFLLPSLCTLRLTGGIMANKQSVRWSFKVYSILAENESIWYTGSFSNGIFGLSRTSPQRKVRARPLYTAICPPSAVAPTGVLTAPA